jgi:hypothetical protein
MNLSDWAYSCIERWGIAFVVDENRIDQNDLLRKRSLKLISIVIRKSVLG